MLEAYRKKRKQNNSQNINEVLLNDDDIQGEILEEFDEIPDDEIADTIEINEKGLKKNQIFQNQLNQFYYFQRDH